MNWKERYQRFKQWRKEPFDYSTHCKGKVTCANCGTVFKSNFCPVCGQKAGTGAMILLVPIYYVISYHQLFGYGWWGTLWRTVLCIWVGLTLILIAENTTNYFMNDQTDNLFKVAIMSATTLLITVIGFLIGWKKRNV